MIYVAAGAQRHVKIISHQGHPVTRPVLVDVFVRRDWCVDPMENVSNPKNALAPPRVSKFCDLSVWQS